MGNGAATANHESESLRDQVRKAVIWRSGTQILGQMIAWCSTFVVIRLLDPADYGLFAMTQVVLVLFNMLNGYGLASSLIQQDEIGHRQMRQLFGMLILLNLALALVQVIAAPLAAAYYRQPMIADLLRVQALLYVTTPFIAFPFALLSRRMDFRSQAQVNLASAVTGAVAALGGAYAGFGVWTLIVAPIILFTTRAVGMTVAAKSLMWPSFDFRGAGSMARYGGLMAAGQFFWFVQSQADVFIAGRSFDPHHLGIYTTSLFLTQIFVSKFVPALNEVAFSAYSRIQRDADAVATAFARSARIIMVAAMPFYLGMAVTAEPLVLVVLGEKWAEAVPIVRLLACAMPFMTMLILFAPASDAMGRPGISARNGATGAVVLPVAFLAGVHWGATGLAVAWIAAYPLYLLIAARRTLPVIGLRARALAGAVTPPIVAALTMALIVAGVDSMLPAVGPVLRLATLVAAGAATYGAWLLLFARDTVTELVDLLRRR
ncbi:lipopolysaccharide biosynthesis protein [Stakelama saccharophila]|uniref:Lipopolysaccharide biosynthesis protein n=1 Tax=Stakelama saccharophila TaxID=3075605 RepID=A0ABZ0BCA6_9SPHN|nr:lipopolysaccharide biosynthesis protein [Stakelama sp. W311]WNO54296.1 lipopolysaccharide biosynthesis protein [Stakelama sp. W311]